jgi:hypothetical protein
VAEGILDRAEAVAPERVLHFHQNCGPRIGAGRLGVADADAEQDRPGNALVSSACSAATSVGSCCHTLRMPVASMSVLICWRNGRASAGVRTGAEPQRRVGERLYLLRRVGADLVTPLPDPDPPELHPGERCR